MNRKHRRATSIQPPQFGTLAEDEAMPEVLVPRAAYTQQRWFNPQFAAQQADDVALAELDIRQGSFAAAELSLLQATDCRFDTTDFASCSLNKAYIRRVEFAGCRLIGLQLTDADLEDVRFSRCNGRLARFWSSSLKSVRFEHCTFPEASFDGSNLTGAVFYKCDLRGADFRNARLKGADLRGSLLAGLQVHSNELAGVIIDPAQALDLIQLLGVTIRAEEAEG